MKNIRSKFSAFLKVWYSLNACLIKFTLIKFTFIKFTFIKFTLKQTNKQKKGLGNLRVVKAKMFLVEFLTV